MSASSTPFRQVHLDFHTPGFVTVGDRFDAEAFGATLAAAQIDGVTAFAHCHHGYSYCDTTIGTRHPGLDFDLFGRMAEELARREIQLLAYFSLNVNEVLSARHPEWHALDAQGKSVNSQILQDGTELFWTWLCPNRGPWARDFLFAHIVEVIDRYPLAGVFVDMGCYLPGSCFCEVCEAKMREQNLDPADTADHERFNVQTIQQLVRDLRATMDARRPGLRLQMGGFNSLGEANKAPGAISEYYIESLAFQTGWEYFPITARYLRNFPLPTLGMTGRFLKNWGDFGTVASAIQLKTQLGMHLMAGVASAIGDHLPCHGEVVPGVYDLIGDAFRFVKARQPWCVGMRPARDAIVIGPAGLHANAAGMTKETQTAVIKDSYTSACKLMHELHLQYDVTTPLDELDFGRCGLIVFAGGMLTGAFIQRLHDFVSNGGLLLVNGAGVVLDDPTHNADWQELIGVTASSATADDGEFYRVSDERLMDAEIPEMAHYTHLPSMDVEFAADVEPLASAWRSPCVRSREHHYGHFHGPATRPAGTAIGVRCVGRGHIVVIRSQLLAAYLQTGYHVHRTVIRRLIDTFMPADRRTLTTNAPSVVDIAVGEKAGDLVLQVQPFVADRRYRYSFESVNEAIDFHGLWVKVRGCGDVERVVDPLTGEEISWRSSGDDLHIDLPPFQEHRVFLCKR